MNTKLTACSRRTGRRTVNFERKIFVSEAARPLRVAVIGAGPAGIYTADILTKSEEVRTGAVEVAIDIFDRYPAPFGLIRYGVAPDHPVLRASSPHCTRSWTAATSVSSATLNTART